LIIQDSGSGPVPDPRAARRAGVWQLALALAGLLVVPFGLRAVNRLVQPPPAQATYLPALEGPRERIPFDPVPIGELAAMNPGYVVIGDSMAGSRIEPKLLTQLTGERIAPLLHPGTGSAWWYLALKNWVIAANIHPRCTFIFFRDTNLTNALFRLDDQFRWAVDRVAHDREDEVNAVIASRRGGLFQVRAAVERTYGASEARRWLEPAVTEWPARVLLPYRRPRAAFMEQLNDRLGLAHLRPTDAADMQAVEDRDADFDRFANKSFLPLMLRDARQAGLPLCFVRVQRRPVGGRPPAQSRALTQYVASLKRYIEANGALFHDDTGDPELSIDLYEDGDHLSRAGRRRYTEIFYNRLRAIFP
jgi:hypothetical protein